MKYFILPLLFINLAFANTDLALIFNKVSKKYSVSHSLLSKIADIESNFDVNAKAKTSSARGLFQIINTTEIWLRELCLIEGDIFDPEVNANMGACYIQHNKKYLEKKLKRKVTDLELYLAHFLGAYRAYKFILMKDTDLAYKMFKNESKANKRIFYHTCGKPKTVREIKDEFQEKLNKARVL